MYDKDSGLEEKGFLYNGQTAKLLLPFLAEIIGHNQNKVNKELMRAYLRGLKTFMDGLESDATRKQRQRVVVD